MIQPFDLALKVHQTDAFNFKMCKTFFFRGSMPPQHPVGSTEHILHLIAQTHTLSHADGNRGKNREWKRRNGDNYGGTAGAGERSFPEATISKLCESCPGGGNKNLLYSI